MIYDYYGFPEDTYHVQYSASGSPEVARQVQELLTQSQIVNYENSERGLDHGTFVPLFLMYPEAQIPVVSLSLKSNYNPHEHIRMGQAIQSLRDEGVLIIGSGLSYHNLPAFFSSTAGAAAEDKGTLVFTDNVYGIEMASYGFGV